MAEVFTDHGSLGRITRRQLENKFGPAIRSGVLGVLGARFSTQRLRAVCDEFVRVKQGARRCKSERS